MKITLLPSNRLEVACTREEFEELASAGIAPILRDKVREVGLNPRNVRDVIAFVLQPLTIEYTVDDRRMD